ALTLQVFVATDGPRRLLEATLDLLAGGRDTRLRTALPELRLVGSAAARLVRALADLLALGLSALRGCLRLFGERLELLARLALMLLARAAQVFVVQEGAPHFACEPDGLLGQGDAGT